MTALGARVREESGDGMGGGPDERATSAGRRSRRAARRNDLCTVCGEAQPFCWACPCGFRICNACMEENLWGMTCSGVNWQCPDCGALRPY